MFLQVIATPIVFSAYKTSGSYTDGQYIDGYDKFLTNYGNTFGLSTGIFTAPKQGVFEFFTATYHYGNSHLLVEKNNISEMDFFSRDSSEDTLSISWIMALQQGDTVRLKVGRFGNFGCGSDGATQSGCIFTGKFIRDI